MKRRGTIRGDLAAEVERDGLDAPAIVGDVLGRGICATAGEDGLTAMHRSLKLCISCTPLIRSSSSSVTAYSTGDYRKPPHSYGPF
ncbi:hypothetical protein P8452_02184 [Trifolium repens]|nr:hypothetical protein P8452_02184 [Trifolium repens]